MKKCLALLAATGLSLMMIGCTDPLGEDEENYDPYPAPSTYTAESYNGIESELNKASFYCRTSELCPENVGLMYTNMSGVSYNPKIGQCTAFLISNDIVATNSHCIPERLKRDRYTRHSCKGQIAVRFITESGVHKILSCKEVLEYSSLELFGPDYAFLKIEASGIKPLRFNKEGLSKGQSIVIPKVNPFSHKAGGELDVEICEVAMGNILNLKANSKWSRTGLGLGCRGVGGNSGSPVLNEQGEVLGILQSKMTEGYRKLLEATFKSHGLKMPSPLPQHIVFTNMSCVADPVTHIDNANQCEADDDLNFTDCVDFLNEESAQNEQKVYDAWKSQLPGIFKYEYTMNMSTITTTARPICVKTKDQFSDYDIYVSKEGVIGFRDQVINLTYPQNITVSAKFPLDAKQNFDPVMEFHEQNRGSFKIDLVEKDGVWTGTENSTYKDWRLNLDFSKIKIPVSLEACTDEQLAADEVTLVKTKDGQTISAAEQMEAFQATQNRVCEQ